MGGIFGGPGGQVQGPGDAYSSPSNVGQSDAKPINIADGPGGKGGDPTVSKTREATVGAKEVSQGPVVNLTWDQRVLLLLSKLEAAKGYKDLQPKLRNEVRALIDSAPDGAYS